VAVVRLTLQELYVYLYTLLRSVNLSPMATASGDSSCLSGLDSRVQLPESRGSRVERGVRAYSPAWSEPPKRNPVARVGMRKRHLTAVCNG
ncbi:hypothetical protein, partial [Brevibacillus laterosporus]|uniref:hypothetical protein n=1 Tax=Brevibacillus laterosporus TaxID=1465 RepID=UPI001CA55A5C